MPYFMTCDQWVEIFFAMTILDPNPILTTKRYANDVLTFAIEQQKLRNKSMRLTDRRESHHDERRKNVINFTPPRRIVNRAD